MCIYVPLPKPSSRIDTIESIDRWVNATVFGMIELLKIALGRSYHY